MRKGFIVAMAMSAALTILGSSSYVIAADLNGDGRPDSQEVDNTVDLNNDGVPDNDQPFVIKSVQATIGSTSVKVGLEVFTNVVSVNTIELVDPATLPQSPVSIPQGMVSFTVQTDSPPNGATAEIIFHYETSLSTAYSLYTYDSTNGWIDHTVIGKLSFGADRKMLSFVVTDGGQGDTDGFADGTITAMVGPAIDGPYLVKDINVDASGVSSAPINFVEMNGFVYFSANKKAENSNPGYELWKSNGTAAGTMMVKDIRTGDWGSYPESLININGTLFFVAEDGINGKELWKSDGTDAGTVMVKDIRPGSSGSSPLNLTVVNGALYFVASDGVNGYELWKSDGTDAGTFMVKDILPGISGSLTSSSFLTNVNGTLFFRANDGVTGNELWKSDGTLGGTVMLKDIYSGISSSNPSNLTSVNGTLFFNANDGITGGELWKSDGTPTGTVLVKDIYPGISSSSPYDLIDANGTLFFNASDGVNGRELWKSNGTLAGTVLVKDINPGVNGSLLYASNLTNINGTLFFAADDGTNLRELWKSDGTANGTVLVKDISSSSQVGSSPSHLTNVNGGLLFTAMVGAQGTELWKSDGTEAGTVLVMDIYPGVDGSSPSGLTTLGGTLLFAADDGVNGTELWKSDGTDTGTVIVRDINIGSESSQAYFFTNVNGTLFFGANDGISGTELWKSDGTVDGTVMVKDMPPGGGAGGFMTGVNGVVYFSASDGTNGSELWKSDGTEAGTLMVKDIYPGANYSSIDNLADVNGTLFFTANDGNYGGYNYQLWKSDGTEPGTVIVKEVNPSGSSSPDNLINVNGILYFTANDGTNGVELWKSDGTEPGTITVKDINTGLQSSSPSNLASYNDTLYFTAYDGSSYQRFTSDGTEAGTSILTDFDPTGYGAVESAGFFYYLNDAGLMKSDGTLAGITLVKNIPNLYLIPGELINVNGTLYFGLDEGDGPTQDWWLWKSDGTEAGTVRVKDIPPSGLLNVDGSLVFKADDGIHGQELWKSDGTEAGTVMLKDIYPGSQSMDMWTFTEVVGRKLYFAAHDLTHGYEMWAYDANNRPTFTAAPAIIGPAYVGRTLSLYSEMEDFDGDTLSVSYLWQADGVDIGTSQPTYDLTASEIGKTVTCTVTADDGFGGVNRLTATLGTVSADPDIDGDGRPDNQEVTPTVDLNGDGTFDNDQLGTIKSVQKDISGTIVQAGLEIGGSTNVTAITMIELVDPAVLPAAPVNLPAGLLSFTVELNAPGATAEMVIFYGDPLPATITTLYKFEVANGWVDFTSTGGMTISADRKKVTYYITDGGPGDADATINGVIVDPIGLGETIDADGDGVPDTSDVCPGFDDNLDADGDGVPDGCDVCAWSDDTQDSDNDGVPNGCDICPGGSDTLDFDGDGIVDGCDPCFTTKPIRMGGTDYWQGIQWAYDLSAQSPFTIQVQGSFINGMLLLNLAKEVTIRGGLNCDFSPNSGLPTIIESLTIYGPGSSVTIDNLEIR